MAVVDWPQKGMGQNIHKKFAIEDYWTPERVAALIERYGEIKAQRIIDAYSSFKGIYQVRHYGNKSVNVREKFYYPGSVNPYEPSEAQLILRAKFAAGVLAWQNLTPEEKQEYNKRGKKISLPGFNLFLREYMLS